MWFLIIAVVAIVAIVVFKANNSQGYYNSKNVKPDPPNYRYGDMSDNMYSRCCSNCFYCNSNDSWCVKYKVYISIDAVCDSFITPVEVLIGKPDKK